MGGRICPTGSLSTGRLNDIDRTQIDSAPIFSTKKEVYLCIPYIYILCATGYSITDNIGFLDAVCWKLESES